MAKYKTSLDEFEEWCENREVPAGVEGHEADGIYNRLRQEDPENAEETTVFDIHDLGEKPRPVNMHLKPFGKTTTLNLSFSHSPETYKIDKNTIPNYFDLQVTGLKQFILSGAVIRTLTISSNIISTTINDCYIDTLHVAGNSNNLILVNCLVGTLALGHGVLNNFTVYGGTIRAVECPASDADNPFTGSVTFTDVDWPTRRSQSRLFKGPQQYRNLRAHMRKLENVPEASRMRALELASQRETDTGTFKYFSWLYWQISNYGRSPAKPLRMALYVYLTMVLAVFLGDAGVLGLEKSVYVGWREGLMGHDLAAEWSRAFFLPGQSIFNPGGIFGTKILVVAKNGGWQFATVFQGLVCDIFLAMFAFAIRKHFKVQ